MLCSDRTLSTISSVNRVSHADLASRSVPLTTPSLFQKLSGTNVPRQGAGPTAKHATRQPPSYRPEAAHHRPPHTSASHSTPRLHTPHPKPISSPKIPHVIRLLDHSTTATNVAIPTTGFQCLKDVRGNYVRDCWETTAQRPSMPHHRRHEARRPRPETRGLVNETTRFR